MRNILILSAMFVTIIANSQNQRDAVKMNEGIFPISVYAGYSNDLWIEGRLTPGYDYNREEDYSFLIGAEYVFAKTGKFQFTAGAYYKKSSTTGNLFVPSETLGNGESFSFNFKKDYGLLQVPLKVGFIQKLTPKLFVNLNGGVTYANLLSDNRDIENDLTLNGERVIGFRSSDVQQVSRIQFEMGARFVYKAESTGLYGVEFMYHIGSIIAGDSILNENNPNEQEYISNFAWLGKYTSVNLHWSPPQRWFQKKK